jgi:hypothetical protein
VPALPSPGQVIRVALDFQVGSDAHALTRFFVAYSGTAPAASDLLHFGGVLNSAADALLPAVMHPDTTYLGCTLTDLASDTGAETNSPETTVGTETGAALGAAVAVVTKLTIGRRYRGGKPKGFWPLGTAADLDTRQTWLSGSVTNFLNAIEAIQTSLEGASSSGTAITAPVNVSYYGPPNRIITGSTGRVRTVSTVRATPLVDTIQAIAVDTHLGSQRRRNLIRT